MALNFPTKFDIINIFPNSRDYSQGVSERTEVRAVYDNIAGSGINILTDDDLLTENFSVNLSDFEGSIDHTGILNIGTNTHAQIDTHIAAAAPHSGHVDTTGNETIAGVKTFSSFPVTPSSAPTTDYQIANKKYVDDSVEVGTPKTIFTGNLSGLITDSNDGDFLCPNGIQTGSDSTEGDVELLVPVAGTAKNFYVRVDTNSNNQNATLTIRKNNANTSVVTTITASTTGEFSDTANTASFAAGDRISILINNATGTGSIDVIRWGFEYQFS